MNAQAQLLERLTGFICVVLLGIILGLGRVESASIDFSNYATNTGPTYIVSSGKVITSFGVKYAFASDATIQPDGKIIIVGTGSRNLEMARYNKDGSLDVSFGSEGIILLDIGFSARSVAAMSDGKILIAGSSERLALARFNSNGDIDTSFGSNGIIQGLHIGYGNVQSLLIQNDGRIIVTGTYSQDNNYKFFVVRYNSEGALDNDFGVNGFALADFGSNDTAFKAALQTDGKIVISGKSNNDFAIARFNSNGSIDTTFGINGKVNTDFGKEDSGNSISIQSDGKLLVAGESGNINEGVGFAIARYHVNGILDSTFGIAGKVRTTFTDFVFARIQSVETQSDGKIIVAGYVHGPGISYAIARYNNDGSLDKSFDTDGIVTTKFGEIHSQADKVIIQIDGKILVTGNSYWNYTNEERYYFAVARYNLDGSLDNTFSPASNTLDAEQTFFESNSPGIVLDHDAQVFDSELAHADNYNGATLTLERHGGASTQDVFSSGTGTLTTLKPGSYFAVDGVSIGRVSNNSDGTLSLTFNDNATQSLVNKTMQQIAYANSSDAPPASVQIDWNFSDGNTGAQGTGGALSVTGSTTVHITPVNDSPILSVALSDITVESNTALTFVVPATTFSDPDGDLLTYFVQMADGTGLPPWLTFNQSTRTLSGTPGTADIGSFQIRVLATDPNGLTATDTIVVTVSNRASQTIGTIIFNPSSLTVGGTTAASATASSGLPVGFASTTPTVCTVSGSTVSGVSTGTCTVSANQAGNATYSAAPQVTQNITVGLTSQTIGIPSFNPTSLSVGGTTMVSATATSGLAVSFIGTTPAICSVLGSTITGIAAGTCSFTANQSGNSTFAAATPVNVAISVDLSRQTIGTISFNPTSLSVGGSSTASATASSGLAVAFSSTTPTICTVNGSAVTGVAAGTCSIAADQAGDASFSAAPQVTSNITVTAANPPRLLNIATRGKVETVDNVMIAGFIIQGNSPKKVLIRARGPSLAAAPFNVPGTLPDPFLTLYSGATPIDSNDDFAQHANVAQIPADWIPGNTKEAAIVTTLNPGAYTAIVNGVGSTSGVAIVEVFEIDQPGTPLINIATRGPVYTGDNVMIAGLIIQGDAPKTVLITARGPSMAGPPHNVPGTLSDPVLTLYSGQTPIASNDDWGGASNASQIQTAIGAPTNPKESAILITLQPGAYTAIVNGANNATGLGIVEVFAQ